MPKRLLLMVLCSVFLGCGDSPQEVESRAQALRPAKLTGAALVDINCEVAVNNGDDTYRLGGIVVQVVPAAYQVPEPMPFRFVSRPTALENPTIAAQCIVGDSTASVQQLIGYFMHMSGGTVTVDTMSMEVDPADLVPPGDGGASINAIVALPPDLGCGEYGNPCAIKGLVAEAEASRCDYSCYCGKVGCGAWPTTEQYTSAPTYSDGGSGGDGSGSSSPPADDPSPWQNKPMPYGCKRKVEWPHHSTHNPGQINVVVHVLGCTQPMPMITLSAALMRQTCFFGSKLCFFEVVAGISPPKIAIGELGTTTNAHDNCVSGKYRGVAMAAIEAPNGSLFTGSSRGEQRSLFCAA